MQESGLQARLRKRYKVTTMSDHDQPVASARSRLHGGRAESTVGRRHDGVRHGGSGKLYLAAILDLFSRFIGVGRQCEQRPPGDHQGAPDGEAPLPRRRPSAPLDQGWRARTIKTCSTRTVLRQHEPPISIATTTRDGELLLDGQERAPRTSRATVRRRWSCSITSRWFYNQRRRHSGQISGRL